MINNDSEQNQNQVEKKPYNKPQTYRVIRMIGEGSFGKAYIVECNADKVIFIFMDI